MYYQPKVSSILPAKLPSPQYFVFGLFNIGVRVTYYESSECTAEGYGVRFGGGGGPFFWQLYFCKSEKQGFFAKIVKKFPPSFLVEFEVKSLDDP